MTGNSAGRLLWLDVAKGIGIVLVVIGHAIGGLIDRSNHSANGALAYVFAAIYFFHMPLFMVLSGLTVVDRVGRGNSFLTGVAKSVVWPYLLWSAVQITLIIQASSLVNTPATGAGWQHYNFLVAPPSQFWFLYGLAILHTLAYALVRSVGRVPAVCVLCALSFGAPLLELTPVLQVVFKQAVWYALGVMAGLGWAGQILQRVNADFSRWLIPTVAAAAVALALVDLHLSAGALLSEGLAASLAHKTWQSTYWIVAVLGIVGTMTLSYCATGHLAQAFAFLGRISMGIFVLHVIFGAGTRIVLERGFGITTTSLLLVAITAVGIVVPALLVYAASCLPRLQPWIGLGPWPNWSKAENAQSAQMSKA